MLRTVKDACTLHESTLDYQVAGGVENLAQVIYADDQECDFFWEDKPAVGETTNIQPLSLS